MNKTKRLALILVSCVLVIAAVVGVSFAVWSNLEKDHVFTLKAGTLELNISSFDVLNSDKPISFDNPVTMSFKVKVEGEKSTLRFGINSFEYSLVEGQFLPLSPDLFDVELPKTMYGVGGKEEPEIVECLIKVSLSNAYDYDSFDPVLMGKKFRFNIRVTAETYTDPVMYDIIYNNVDGAIHDNITQWSVETNHEFKDAEKFGYIFGGWYTDALLTPESRITELTQDDPNINTLNVYAKWIPIKYAITYDFGSGYQPENIPEEYTIEDNIDFNLYKPLNDDSTLLFGGYYLDAEFTKPITEIKAGTTGAINIYAKWVQQYNITYIDRLSVENANPIVFSALDNEIILSDLTADGYVFDGWYIGEEKVTTIDTLTESDIELTAKWTAISYSITWNENGGTLADGTPDSYTIESDAIDPSAYEPIRDGYTFNGWFTDEEFITLAETIVTGSTENRIFYAKWTAISYSITWNENGGTLADGTPESYTIESEDIDPSAFVPTREGYTFEGWFTDVDCLTPATKITNGSTGARIFYAKWTATPQSITWKPNGGTLADGTPDSYTIESDAIDPSAYEPIRDGYTFSGWFTDESFLTPATTITNGSTGARIFYAKWTAISYSITWNENGGALADGTPESYTIESLDITPSAFAPTRNGYEFNGWFTDVDCLTPAETIVTGSTENRIFYAKWTAISYSITWNANGGTPADGTPENYTIESNEIDPSVFAPTRDGYTFSGWFIDENFETPATTIVIGSTGEKVFYAKWTAIPYSITWNENGGTLADGTPESYTIETLDITPSAFAPTRNGYEFNGWFTDEDYLNPAETIVTGSTGARTFYAKWIANTYKITWEYSGGNEIVDIITEYTYDKALNIESYVPVRNGYTFDGWYLNESKITEIAVGTIGDITIVAKWIPTPQSITWNTNGGTLTGAPDSYTIESDEIDPSAYEPTREGYSFDGWYDSNDLIYPAEVIATGSTGARTFYAKWSIVTYTLEWELNGGTSVKGLPTTYDITHPDNIIMLVNMIISKEGYKFLGWYDNAEFTGTPITKVGAGSVGNYKLFAKWELVKYKISYTSDYGDASELPATYTIEDEIDLTQYTLSPFPENSNYRFAGFYTDESYSQQITTISKGQTDNIDIYVKWLEVYTITWELGDGVMDATPPSDYTVEDSIDLSAYQPTKDGFNFTGWHNGAEIVTSIPTGSTGNITLTAQWEEITVPA